MFDFFFYFFLNAFYSLHFLRLFLILYQGFSAFPFLSRVLYAFYSNTYQSIRKQFAFFCDLERREKIVVVPRIMSTRHANEAKMKVKICWSQSDNICHQSLLEPDILYEKNFFVYFTLIRIFCIFHVFLYIIFKTENLAQKRMNFRLFHPNF